MRTEEFENLNDINKIEDAIVELQSTVKRLDFKRDRLINQRKEEIEDLLTVMRVKKILHISSQLYKGHYQIRLVYSKSVKCFILTT
jgi:hypothetical protein